MIWMLVAFGAGAELVRSRLPSSRSPLSAVLVRPPVASGPSRALDIALLCCVAWTFLQIVPLPPGLRDILSPNADAIDRALRFDGNVRSPSSAVDRSLSYSPGGDRDDDGRGDVLDRA